MAIRVVQLGTPRAAGEGLRIGTVRRPPRGVPKSEHASRDFYDVWLPELAPSETLVKQAQNATDDRAWLAFARRYRAEMKRPEAARLLDLLAALSKQSELAVGCYCNDERRCHRSLLRTLLAEHGAELASLAHGGHMTTTHGRAVSKTFRATIVKDGPMCLIPLTFDPRTVFGKVRAPVKVTLNGYTYRSTIAAMGGPPCVPLRKSHREAAGLEGGETLDVRLDLDSEPRVARPPADFVKALKATPRAWERWRGLSYTHQREHVEAIEDAKAPETRARRIRRAVAALGSISTRKRQG